MIYINSHGSTTVILDGIPYSVAAGTPQYDHLQAAIAAQDEDAARRIVNTATELEKSLGKFGEVEVFSGHVTFRGEPLSNYLVDVILHTQDPEPVASFLNNVLLNPSRRAVQDLYKWCEAAQMPLTRDGHITAYKLVREDFKDIYTGTFDNSPGQVVEVARNMVDEDPNRTCSHGLHFCSAGYLPHYGSSNSKVVLVKVNPRDVVAFPTDYNLAKARCCRYEVLEEIDRDKVFNLGIYEEQRYWIKDRDGDYLSFDEGGHGYHDKPTQDFTRAEAQAYIDGYRGGSGPLEMVKVTQTFDIPEGDRFVVWSNTDEEFLASDSLYDTTRCEEDAFVFTREEVLELLEAGTSEGVDLDVRVAPPEPQAEPEPERVVIWSTTHKQYWASPGMGLASSIETAHVYTRAEAEEVTIGARHTVEFQPAPQPVDDATILGRVGAIEKQLGFGSLGSISERLDAIERELGLEKIEPLIARIERAESQLGLS